VVDPNLRAVVDHVRKGTLDFVLLKPHDAQLLVSLSRTVPAKIFHVIGGLGLVVYATAQQEHSPTIVEMATAAALLGAGVTALYGLWLTIVSTAFWFVRIDNLSYLLMSVLESGRWPVTVYRSVVRFVLTFVIPVGIMTTYPALALRGTLTWTSAAAAMGAAAAFLVVSRRVWVFALTHYSSASS
jgi:ABC-2 type transport system permease protein